jgi:hypothetical protein
MPQFSAALTLNVGANSTSLAQTPVSSGKPGSFSWEMGQFGLKTNSGGTA